jgi:hypothetical protein
MPGFFRLAAAGQKQAKQRNDYKTEEVMILFHASP